jgi:3',5'-cyclic AMP phosphodiesterase CpdA
VAPAGSVETLFRWAPGSSVASPYARFVIQFGQVPPPTHVIAHVSDPHLLAGDARQYGAIDTVGHLRTALDRLTRIDPPPQALVLTGDLADLGEPEAYRTLRDLVEPIAATTGAQVVWCMGNHDERAAYSRELFGEESDAPQDRAYDVAGLRIVSLDTSVPGWHHGEITDVQLAWLDDTLATPAEHGTILALHHPPIPSPLVPAAEIIELRDTGRLAAVLRGSDVRAILGGHYHFTSHSTFAGIPVSVAAATCYTVDTAPLGRLISAVDGHQAFTMVHVYADRVVHSVVPVPAAPEVDGYGADVAPLLEALSAVDRLDLVSRKDSPLNTGELTLDPPPLGG